MTDNAFVFYLEYGEKLSRLTDEQLGKLMRALIAYKQYGDICESGDVVVDMAFDFIRVDIDKQSEKYRQKAEAGRKGGSTNKQNEADESKTKQNEAEASRTKQNEAEKEKDIEKEKEKEIEIEIENDIERESTPNGVRKRARFVPPTLEEVRAYCNERGSSVDPVRFFEYFDSGGWTDSRGQKVKNWKQKLITWESHGNGTRAAPACGDRDIVSEWMNA